jgi:hypothetical protein
VPFVVSAFSALEREALSGGGKPINERRLLAILEQFVRS